MNWDHKGKKILAKGEESVPTCIVVCCFLPHAFQRNKMFSGCGKFLYYYFFSIKILFTKLFASHSVITRVLSSCVFIILKFKVSNRTAVFFFSVVELVRNGVLTNK